MMKTILQSQSQDVQVTPYDLFLAAALVALGGNVTSLPEAIVKRAADLADYALRARQERERR
jgi:hypothetical protein